MTGFDRGNRIPSAAYALNKVFVVTADGSGIQMDIIGFDFNL